MLHRLSSNSEGPPVDKFQVKLVQLAEYQTVSRLVLTSNDVTLSHLQIELDCIRTSVSRTVSTTSLGPQPRVYVKWFCLKYKGVFLHRHESLRIEEWQDSANNDL